MDMADTARRGVSTTGKVNKRREPADCIGECMLEDAHAPHSHDHSHHTGHSHTHAHSHSSKRLTVIITMTLAFMVLEVIGGVISNSLALIADAAHMLTDVAALGLSLFVMWFSRRPARPEKTYGYLRVEILAALINGVTLVVIACACNGAKRRVQQGCENGSPYKRLAA